MKNYKLKQKYTLIAKENEEIFSDEFYFNPNGDIIDLSVSLERSRRNALYISPLDEVECISPTELKSTKVEVTKEDSVKAIIRLSNEGSNKIGCLNFASAKSPGGGFLEGSIAQEEDLCRSSTLYDSISYVPEFYEHDLDKSPGEYTDSMILSPSVQIFRVRDKNNNYPFVEIPYSCGFITCAAVNMTCYTGGKEEEIMRNRIRRVLRCFHSNGYRDLVLGAWGCGAFGNDPTIIAALFKEALDGEFKGLFENVCFAIHEKLGGTKYPTFKKIFSE